MQEMAFQGLYILKFSRESMPPALLQVSRAFGARPPQEKTKLYAYGHKVTARVRWREK